MRQLLENIIREWQNRKLPTIIPRKINLEDYLNLRIKKIISVIGFRRTGKTFLLLSLTKKIGQKNTIYLNFEDERLPKKTEVLTMLSDLIEELFPQKKLVLLLDEIQNIPNWNLWLRRLIETKNYSIFISGSSSKLSSAELPTQLRGRSLTIKINSLNFKEFLNFKNEKIEFVPNQKKLALMREYLLYGGFPEIVLSEEGKKPLILDEYFQTFIKRDIIERYKIRNKEEFNLLIQLLLNSSYYTYSSLAKALKLAEFSTSKNSLIRYLNFLQESFFFKEVFLNTPSLKNRLKAPKKPIFIDNYFLYHFSSEFSQNLGRLMENLVGLTLKNQDKIFYYWKNYQEQEVDFVIQNQEKTEELIQISYVNQLSDIKPREIRSLIKAKKYFKTANLTLITWNYQGILKEKGEKINCIPLYQWLLK